MIYFQNGSILPQIGICQGAIDKDLPGFHICRLLLLSTALTSMVTLRLVAVYGVISQVEIPDYRTMPIERLVQSLDGVWYNDYK